MADDDLHAVTDSLELVVRGLRGASAKATAGVFGRWEDVVGEHVAAHARPVALDDGRLLVEVDEPGWATQLRYLEAESLGVSPNPRFVEQAVPALRAEADRLLEP